MRQNITPSRGLRGTLTIPGDKSISHRSIMFGALAEVAAADTAPALRATAAAALPSFAGPFDKEDKL